MIQGTLSLGALHIPYILLLIVAAAAAGHLTVLLIQGSRRMKKASDLLFSLLTAYLALWRLSLVLTHREALRGSFSALFVLPGGGVNHAIGAAAAILTLAFFLYRKKTDPRALGSLILLALSAMILMVILSLLLRSLLSPPPAPESTGSLTVMTPDGEEVELVLTGAEATVINLWASWCLPCRAEMPELRRWWSEYGEGEVRFYALNMTDSERSRERLLAFIREEAGDIPVYLDTEGLGSSLFKVSALPTTLVFNRRGELAASRTGAVDRPWLENAVRRAGNE
jgi:thiol-disulfide isomerase/thioredoxin